jgi:GH15 family glucan-1,4-alpha-glucosidase
LKNILPTKDGSFEVDLTVDASIYAPFYFGVFNPEDEKVVNTMNAIKERLWVKTEVGGIARYEEDYYHRVSEDTKRVPGNPWVICTLWLAQWTIAKAKNPKELQEALPILEWVAHFLQGSWRAGSSLYGPTSRLLLSPGATRPS